MDIQHILLYLGAFLIVAVAAGRIAGVFQKLKLPLITGFLAIGLLSGPEFLGLIDQDALHGLSFVNDIALAFIAFAVGSELYLKELRNRMRSIVVMTISQMVVTFTLVSIAVFLISDLIAFTREMNQAGRIAISLLAGTISIARSPASAIAIINELRARGPFTQTAIGVTVLKDFAVIVVFAVMFTLSQSMIREADFRMIFILQAVIELILAFGYGFLVWLVLRAIFSLKGMLALKKGVILVLGFLVYLFTQEAANISGRYMGMTLHIEPLLICIVGSFLLTNFSVYRNDFIRIIKELGPYVYVLFLP
jgi:Kef-type K+ transport system membrane component KefB